MSKFGIEEKSAKLNAAFRHFQIGAEATGATVTERIITFDVSMHEGTGISEILQRLDDIRYYVGDKHLRINTDGYSGELVGVEMGVDEFGYVPLLPLLQRDDLISSKIDLPIIVGKDTKGNVILEDLSKSSNMLIAGNAGMGKSAFIRNIIATLTQKKTPDEVQFVLFDPKQCEFECFGGIKHLKMPIITDYDDARDVLVNLISEMNERYEKIEAAGARNIKEYNVKVKDVLPSIIIIIDELRDYVVRGGEDFEKMLYQLSLHGRAAGIHVIASSSTATDAVITPIMKINLFAKAIFRVYDEEESRWVLHEPGAERLLDKGDILYTSICHMNTTRVQVPYISEKEFCALIPKLKAQQSAEDLLALCDQIGSELIKKGESSGMYFDEQFREALKFVFESGHISTAAVQKRFNIGYGKAAVYCDEIRRLLEM